jgi:hypothetical protein
MRKKISATDRGFGCRADSRRFSLQHIGAILFAVAGHLCISSADADTLVRASAITPTNDQLLHFNEIYRVNPHNTYNPHSWSSLTDVISNLTEPECRNIGGVFVANKASRPCAVDHRKVQDQLKQSLTQAISGQKISNLEIQHWMDATIEHCPSCEDTWTDGNVTAIWRAVNSDLFYGNNCDTTPVDIQHLGGFSNPLAACLQQVRNWMDDPAHANHTPIMVYFDIKQDLEGFSALAFDTIVRATFRDKLITPETISAGQQRAYAGARERVMQEGWPTVRDMRGKVLAVFTGGEAFDATPGDTEPNDTLRKYVDALTNDGFRPSTFVCPRILKAADVDSPPGFGGSADRLRDIACNNIYTGTGKFGVGAVDVTFESAMSSLYQLHSKNFLSYVWSYTDDLAVRPEVAMELVRRGASWFDDEQPDRHGVKDSPVDFLTGKVMPWEGVGGITSYGFVIRQRNNPTFVLANDPVKGPSLQAYTGAPSQQWALTSTGRMFALSDPNSCLGFPSWGTAEKDDYPLRNGALYSSISTFHTGYKVPAGSGAVMTPCNDPGKDLYFTLVPAYLRNSTKVVEDPPVRVPPKFVSQPQIAAVSNIAEDSYRAPETMGIKIALIQDKLYQANGVGIYLTPTAYNETAKLQAATYANLRWRLPGLGHAMAMETLMRGPAAVYDDSGYDPANDNADNSYIYQQEFELYFDKTHALRLIDGTLPVPPLANIDASDMGIGSFVPPKTWKDYPLTASNVGAVAVDQLMPAVEKDMWNWAYAINNGSYNGATVGGIDNGNLPWWTIPRAELISGDTPNDPRFGNVSYGTAAASFMSADEFSKWKSASATPASEFPNDGSYDAELLAEEMLSNSQQIAFRNAGPNSISWPLLKYWQVYNDREIWWPISNILSPDEYKKWTDRLQFTPKSIALDPTLDYVARQLLETDDRPAYYIASQSNELQQYFWERGWTCQTVPTGTNPLDVCGDRYLRRSLGSDGHYHQNGNDGLYHWNMIPFKRTMEPLAAAAFNPPDPQYAQHAQPQDWAYWSEATALQDAVGDRPLTYSDVPLGGDYHTIVIQSDLLSATEKKRYLEHERLETQVVAQGHQVTYWDIDPDADNLVLAQHYLSATDLGLWKERVAVTLNDVPNTSNFFHSPAAAKLLSSDELSVLSSKVGPRERRQNDPLPPNPPLPTVWTDIPPAKTKRIVAEVLLPGDQYIQWKLAASTTADDFPQFYSNTAIDTLALGTLSFDNYNAWRNRIGPSAPEPAQLNWLMCPHWATSIAICNVLLSPEQAKIWDDMISYAMLYQYLGGSSQMWIYAKSTLDAPQYANWQAYAAQQNKALTWQAFLFDKSLLQEQIVKTVFGANSTDYAAWRSWAGR